MSAEIDIRYGEEREEEIPCDNGFLQESWNVWQRKYHGSLAWLHLLPTVHVVHMTVCCFERPDIQVSFRNTDGVK